jgi:hypothetical protein
MFHSRIITRVVPRSSGRIKKASRILSSSILLMSSLFLILLHQQVTALISLQSFSRDLAVQVSRRPFHNERRLLCVHALPPNGEEEHEEIEEFDDFSFKKFSYDSEDDEQTFEPVSSWSDDDSSDKTVQADIPSPSNQDETQRMIQEQQKQIDLLMQLIQSQNPTGGSGNTSPASKTPAGTSSSLQPPSAYTPTLPPLKVMLFIDGTWLYYSIHERDDNRDPITARYGKGWQFKYYFDWSRLPGIICQALQNQDQGWSSVNAQVRTDDAVNAPQQALARPLEIVRACVFSSYKADTAKTSRRYQMFQEMISANYDVTVIETIGKNEKCVDIQLAVEMLHYATVPSAYDVALLLTGDKDFMPAMVRTRQKGRKVGLVSMRSGCNKALYQTPNVKDYDVVWIEDYLDELIKLKPESQLRKTQYLSTFTLWKIINDFISKSGRQRVSSRDIGAYLKHVKVGERSVLDEVKECFGGLYQFLIVSGIYVVIHPESNNRASDDKSFWVGLREGANASVLLEAKKTHFTDDEKRFFDQYNLDALEDKGSNYRFTITMPGSGQERPVPELQAVEINGVPELEPPEELTRDYSGETVLKLKERCRERGLSVSGKKVELLKRIQQDVEEGLVRPKVNAQSVTVPVSYIDGLVVEYLQASGGLASSRGVGRYLAANQASAERTKDASSSVSALQELKTIHGSLIKYLKQSPALFYIEEREVVDGEHFEFSVGLQK